MGTNRLSRSRVVRASAVAVFVVAVATLGFAQAGQSQQGAAAGAQARNGKKYVAAKEIIFDKAAGKLRKPTTEETQVLVDQIGALTNRSTDGLTVTQHANGMLSMRLDGRFSGVLLGRALEDGSTEIRCVTTFEEAVEFLGLETVSQQ